MGKYANHYLAEKPDIGRAIAGNVLAISAPANARHHRGNGQRVAYLAAQASSGSLSHLVSLFAGGMRPS